MYIDKAAPHQNRTRGILRGFEDKHKKNPSKIEGFEELLKEEEGYLLRRQ